MTEQEIDARRLEHWRDSARMLGRIQWAVGIFGISAILACIWVGVQLQTVTQHTRDLERIDRAIDAQDVRMRSVEQSERTTAAELRSLSQGVSDIRADQRAMRALLERYLMPERDR